MAVAVAGAHSAEQQAFREFQRARESGAEVHLLIEGADWEKVEGHAYVSRLHPAALEGNLFSWASRYGLRLWFCPPSFSGKLVYQIFRYHLREMLRREEDLGDAVPNTPARGFTP